MHLGYPAGTVMACLAADTVPRRRQPWSPSGRIAQRQRDDRNDDGSPEVRPESVERDPVREQVVTHNTTMLIAIENRPSVTIKLGMLTIRRKVPRNTFTRVPGDDQQRRASPSRRRMRASPVSPRYRHRGDRPRPDLYRTLLSATHRPAGTQPGSANLVESLRTRDHREREGHAHDRHTRRGDQPPPPTPPRARPAENESPMRTAPTRIAVRRPQPQDDSVAVRRMARRKSSATAVVREQRGKGVRRHVAWRTPVAGRACELLR